MQCNSWLGSLQTALCMNSWANGWFAQNNISMVKHFVDVCSPPPPPPPGKEISPSRKMLSPSLSFLPNILIPGENLWCYCLLSQYPKEWSECPEDCIERHPATHKCESLRHLNMTDGHGLAVFLQSVPWFGANAARYFKSTFEMNKLSWSWFPGDWCFTRKPRCRYANRKRWRPQQVKPREGENLVYGTKGITACPSEVWLWISLIGHWRLYHCTNCV